MSFRGLRTLLPAAISGGSRESEASSSDPGSTSQPSDTSGPPPTKRRSTASAIACTECRARKKRCDGHRPACSNCIARKIPLCIYPDRSEDPGSEILKLLRSLSISRARSALAVLRSQHDEATALSIIKHADPASHSPPSQAHDHPARQQLVPLNLELSSAYPNAYPKLRPVSANAISQSGLAGPPRPPKHSRHSTEQSHVHEARPVLRPLKSAPSPGEHAGEAVERFRPPVSTQPIDSDSLVRKYRYPISTHGKSADRPAYCDERLRRLQIRFWTNVDVSNDFAASAISLYLETDHPLLGLFDPDLFLTDLIEQRERYCSSFLVNALMFLSCQMYSALAKTASTYINPFWMEAEACRHQQKNRDSVTTMSALVLLSLSLTGHGKDHTVIRFSQEANTIGDRLGFYNPDSDLARKNPSDMSDDDRVACHAAWSSFNWSMIIALFHRQPEAAIVENPPSVPILEYWSGRAPPTPSSIKSASVASPIVPATGMSQLLGPTFTALCQFWKIMHGAIWVYYPTKVYAPPQEWKWQLAEHKFREILAWTVQLPDALTRGGSHLAQVDVLHMWIHAALMDLMRPFTGSASGIDERLSTFSASDNTALKAYKASSDQLKRLILDYRTNHEASAYSILWHTGLLYLVNAMLDKPRDPDWHIYFLLCVHGYETLRRPYLISEAIGKGLLAMTLRKTDMSAEEARSILAEIEEQGELMEVDDGGSGGQGSKGIKGENIRAPFMGDLDLALRDPKTASVEAMASVFEELALFDEVMDQSVIDPEDL